jgi:hypothetical protein
MCTLRATWLFASSGTATVTADVQDALGEVVVGSVEVSACAVQCNG